jgi:hypothetical protein
MKRAFIVLVLLVATDGAEKYFYTKNHENGLFLDEDGKPKEFASPVEVLQAINDNNTLAEADKLPKGVKRPEVFSGQIIIQEIFEF